MGIIIKKMSEEEAKALGITSWPRWEQGESSFDWYYGDNEDCYLLEGEVEVETSEGEKVRIGKGDLVHFPCGIKCKWHITKPIKQFYHFC